MTEPEVPEYRFDIKSSAEQYDTRNAENFRDFLKKWFAANDSIVPQFVDRWSWDGWKSQFRLQPQPDGKQLLVMPEDLQLWEMVEVINVIDRDTFKDNPAKRAEVIDKQADLRALLADSGVYIAKHLNAIKDKSGAPDQVAQGIAKALAEELYLYGSSNQMGHKVEAETVEELSQMTLSPEEEEKIERWLVGNEFYDHRQKLAQKRGIPLEQMRDRTISQFFETAKKAFQLIDDPDLNTHTGKNKPWEDDRTVQIAFLQKIHSLLRGQIELPRQQLVEAVSRRGLEKLLHEMKASEVTSKLSGWLDAVGIHVPQTERKLYEQLNVPKLKRELAKLRESKNVKKIAQKERDIALSIQRQVSQYSWKESNTAPSTIVSERTMNCAGFSAVAGALFREIGLQYYVTTMDQEHSTVILLTSDHKAYWNDMQTIRFNSEITNAQLKGNTADGEEITVESFFAAAKDDRVKSLSFTLDLPRMTRGVGKTGPIEVDAIKPGDGEAFQLLKNMSNDAFHAGDFALAREMCLQAIKLVPETIEERLLLADIYAKLNQPVMEIELCLSILKSHPDVKRAYQLLSSGYSAIGLEKRAYDTGKKALELGAEKPIEFFNLGSIARGIGEDDVAIEHYQKFLQVATSPIFAPRVSEAKKAIAELLAKKTNQT